MGGNKARGGKAASWHAGQYRTNVLFRQVLDEMDAGIQEEGAALVRQAPWTNTRTGR
jgi:hypothetical protein